VRAKTFRVRSPIFRVPDRWGQEGLASFATSFLVNHFAKGKVNDWPPDYQPFVRLLRSKKRLLETYSLDLLPPDLKAVLTAGDLKQLPREKDRAIAHFFFEKGPKRGEVEAVVKEAEKFFDLSRSAIFRALARDKKRHPDRHPKKGEEWFDARSRELQEEDQPFKD